MKIQYEIDGQGGLTGKSRLVDDDVVETIIFKNAWENDGYLNHSYDISNSKWVGNNNGLEQAELKPNETDQLKLMVGNLISENAKKEQSIKQLQTMTGTLVAQIAELNKGENNMYEMIKQCYEWGVYTADYVKSFFVDECQTITQEQYEQIVAAKQ